MTLNEENDAKKSKYAFSFQTIKKINNILNQYYSISIVLNVLINSNAQYNIVNKKTKW